MDEAKTRGTAIYSPRKGVLISYNLLAKYMDNVTEQREGGNPHITSPMGSQIASNDSHLAPSRAQKRPIAQNLTQLQALVIDPVSG